MHLSNRFHAAGFALLFLMSGLLATTGVACAQDFPSKRVTIIVPYPAGGNGDGVTRIYANGLKDRFGQTVVVENRVGAGGVVATEALVKSPADGYTIGLVGQLLTTPKPLMPMATFEAPRDFTYLGRIVASNFLVVVPADVPARNLREFVAYARANPGKLNYGVVPNSIMQLDMVRFTQITDSKIVEVPFNGAAPLVTAIMGAQVQMSFLGATVVSQIKAGKLVALAAASKKRWTPLPEVPTAAEQGYDFESGYWFGFAGPAGLPAPVVARWTRDLAEVAKLQEVRDGITKTWSMEAIDPSPAEMADYLKKEAELNNSVARSMGLMK